MRASRRPPCSLLSVRQHDGTPCADGVNEQDWPAQLKHVEELLQSARAMDPRWMFVVGHHPVYSHGEHGNTAEMIAQLKPLLDKYKVQVRLRVRFLLQKLALIAACSASGAAAPCTH